MAKATESREKTKGELVTEGRGNMKEKRDMPYKLHMVNFSTAQTPLKIPTTSIIIKKKSENSTLFSADK